MCDMEFWSADRRFGLDLGEEQRLQLISICEATGGRETGGILVGYYTKTLDCAIVTAISGAPADSESRRTSFERGVHGLQRWLNDLWRRTGHYYLGEWHYHPGAPAEPSWIDIQQMEMIAQSQRYRCPEPILLIIGGDLATRWDTRIFVFPRGKEELELVGEP